MVVVAIVGIDGSGKTTQAKRLVENLKSEGYDAVYVEPAFMLLKQLAKTDQEALQSLLGPRKARISTTGKERGHSLQLGRILPAILGYGYALLTYFLIARKSNEKRIVVCDRYFFQFFFDLFGKHADSIISVFPKPDITFYLDGHLDSLYSRMIDPSDASTTRTYFLGVETLFEDISKKYGFIRLGAERDPDLIGREILQEIVTFREVAKHGEA